MTSESEKTVSPTRRPTRRARPIGDAGEAEHRRAEGEHREEPGAEAEELDEQVGEVGPEDAEVVVRGPAARGDVERGVVRVVGRERDDRGDGERDEADAGDLPQAVPPRRPASALLAPPMEGVVLFLLPAAGHGVRPVGRSAFRQHRGGEARHGPAVEAELPELAGARPAQHQQDREIAGRGGGGEPGGGERDRDAGAAGRRVAQFEERGAADRGQREQEGEAHGVLAAQTDREPGDDRAARARDPGHDRDALRDADEGGSPPRGALDGQRGRGQQRGGDQERAGDGEGADDRRGRGEQALEEILEGQSDDRGRHRRGDQQQQQAPRPAQLRRGLPVGRQQPPEHGGDVAAVERRARPARCPGAGRCRRRTRSPGRSRKRSAQGRGARNSRPGGTR